MQVGNDITNIEAVRFQLKSQFDRNVVTHFEVQEYIFNYTFSHLGIDTEYRVDHPIVISEPFLNPNYSRACKLNFMFIYCLGNNLSYNISYIRVVLLMAPLGLIN